MKIPSGAGGGETRSGLTCSRGRGVVLVSGGSMRKYVAGSRFLLPRDQLEPQTAFRSLASLSRRPFLNACAAHRLQRRARPPPHVWARNSGENRLVVPTDNSRTTTLGCSLCTFVPTLRKVCTCFISAALLLVANAFMKSRCLLPASGRGSQG